MFKRLLQCRLFGHPLHPILVHMPIGLFLISFAFDIGAITHQITSPDRFVRPAFYTMLLGELTALIAAIPGLMNYFTIPRHTRAWQTATYHLWLNLLVLGLYLLNLLIRWTMLDHSEPRVVPVVLSVCALVALGVSGYLGARLIYEDGIGVSPSSPSSPRSRRNTSA